MNIIRPIILIEVILTLSSAQTSTAVINFVGINISKSETDTVTEVLRTELSNIGSFQVLKRDKMEQILEEQGFDQTGCISRRCLVDVGILLEVHQVLGGTIGKRGGVLIISSRLIDVETSELVKSLRYEWEGSIDSLLASGLTTYAMELAGRSLTTTEEVDTTIVSGLFIFPRVGFGLFNDKSAPSWGGTIGYGSDSWGRIGIDFMAIWIDNAHILLTYERKLFWFMFQGGLGFGITRYNVEESPGTRIAKSISFRFGLGYEFELTRRFVIKPALELNWGMGNEWKRVSNMALSLNFGFKGIWV